MITGFANVVGDTSQHAAIWLDGKVLNLGTLGGPNSGVKWPLNNQRGMVAGISDC